MAGFETKYGIKIEPAGLSGAAKANYVHGVRTHLSWIDGTNVGQLLLKAIGWHARNNPGNLAGGVVSIQPYTGGKCNAAVGNSTSTATGWSRPTVNYSPGVYATGGPCHTALLKASTNRGLYPDELLFHELVHAFRGAAARFNSAVAAGGGLSGYGNREEFIAVLTTNIYISDPSNGSKTGLRKNWNGFAPLEKGLDGSLDFFRSSKNAFSLIDGYCKDNPAFTRWIAAVKAHFNPIAAYYGDPATARSLSNGAVALVRDGDWVGLLGNLLAGNLTP